MFYNLKIKFRFLYRPIVDLFRVRKSHLGNRKDAEFWAGQLNLHYRNSKNKPIAVIYSDEDTPPLYADFLVVVLLVRFLALHKLKVKFYVSSFGKYDNKWNVLSSFESQQFHLEQKKILARFLPSNVEVIYSKKSRSVIENIALKKNNLVLSRPKIDGIAPYVLQLLISRHKFKIPTNFLLKTKKRKKSKSYIAFGVRRSKWDSFRDSTQKTIKKDFKNLSNAFPNQNIMLLSNSNGLSYAFKALFNADEVTIIKYGNIRVIPQPKNGYLNGIELLLDSDFYFQRSGGGMIVPAIFSTVPYLFLHQMKLNFYGSKRRAIVPWSSDFQIYIYAPQIIIKIFPLNRMLKEFNQKLAFSLF